MAHIISNNFTILEKQIKDVVASKFGLKIKDFFNRLEIRRVKVVLKGTSFFPRAFVMD